MFPATNADRAHGELLDEIDFQAIADHWLARFSGYRRRERHDGLHDV